MKKKLYLVFDHKQTKNFQKEYHLKKQGDELELNIMFLGKGKWHNEFHLRVVHEAPETKSVVRFRSALLGACHLSVFGNITIEKNARASEAFLEMRSLLLNDKARARLDPTLDIFENNVRASHAASIGRISEEELFYLRSRGLGKKEAETLFLKEYFMPVTQYAQI